MDSLNTARLKLVPATLALARAEIGDRVEFARLLDASVPDTWPPKLSLTRLPWFLDCLEAAPGDVGWFGWYALATSNDVQSLVLVASVGFKGPPQDGAAEIGYSVLPQFQRLGYATEMVAGLVGWALSQPGVQQIVADTEWANPASVRSSEQDRICPMRANCRAGWFPICISAVISAGPAYSMPTYFCGKRRFVAFSPISCASPH